jgi:hypothetical protein
MMAQRNVTDRALRYRAQKNVRGPKKCVICGSTRNIDVMHLDGNESHGDAANLAYGCRSCNGKLAAAFKRLGKGRPTNQYNPAGKEPPTFQQYAWAVSQQTGREYVKGRGFSEGDHGEAGAIIHATPRSLRAEYAARIAAGKRGRARSRDLERWNPADRRAILENRIRAAEAAYAKEKARGRSGAAASKDAYRALQELKKLNPAAAAADAFKEFHGHNSKEVVSVKRKVHHHDHLAAAGELRGMSVKPVSKVLEVRHIGGLGKALLCFNESKNQLFIEGGDQFMSSAELKKFGITHPHELETLGKVTAFDYFTNKTHLGDEGGEAVYAHQLRTTNEDGKHVVVAIARYPDLIYRVLDQQMEFSGGSYEIRAEGIDK